MGSALLWDHCLCGTRHRPPIPDVPLLDVFYAPATRISTRPDGHGNCEDLEMVDRLIASAQRVLVLAPHTDDAELGCGGTIARLLRMGTTVFVAAFSTAEESLPPGAVPTRLRDEFLSSMKVLGVPHENTFVFG